MPETTVTLRWPDGAALEFYSPSLVVHEHLESGRAYPLPELVTRCRQALTLASERVRASYGFPCSRAADSIAQIERVAATYPQDTLVVVG